MICTPYPLYYLGSIVMLLWHENDTSGVDFTRSVLSMDTSSSESSTACTTVPGHLNQNANNQQLQPSQHQQTPFRFSNTQNNPFHSVIASCFPSLVPLADCQENCSLYSSNLLRGHRHLPLRPFICSEDYWSHQLRFKKFMAKTRL